MTHQPLVELERIHVPRPTPAARLSAAQHVLDRGDGDVIAALGLDWEARALAAVRLATAVHKRT